MSGIGAMISAGIKTGAAAIGKGLAAVGGAGEIVGAGVDVGFGGAAVQQAASTSMTEGEKAYQITGEIIGIGLNVGIGVASSGSTVAATLTGGAALGPVGIAIAAVIAIVQILGSIIDSFVNPFQPMFNRNLNEMRAAYHSAIKNAYLEMGLSWPLEIKPDLMNVAFGNEQNQKKYFNHVNKYYSDNNLITDTQYLEVYNLMLEARKLVRNKKAFLIDKEGNLIGTENIDKAILEIESDSQSNLLLMLALQARIAKYKKENRPKSSIIKQFVETYYIGMIIWSISLCLLIFLSIFFLFI